MLIISIAYWNELHNITKGLHDGLFQKKRLQFKNSDKL